MDGAAIRLRFRRLSLLGNLVGAVLVFFYFHFIDYSPPAADDASAGATLHFAWHLAYFVAVLAVLGFAGVLIARRWIRPLVEVADAGAPASPLVLQRALLLPHVVAAITAAGWVAAGVLWGILWPLLTGTFSLRVALRTIFGITGIGGSLTTAFMFLAVERRWRFDLARLFADTAPSAVHGVPRFPVRARLLLVFLLISVIPLTLLGVLAYTRAAVLVGAGPALAAELMDGMLALIVFLLAVGIVAATGLAVFVSGSVARPLGEVQAAMAEVERGDLAVRCPAVAKDEIGAVAEGFNRMVHGLRDREVLRETFGKYVTPEIRDEILAGRVTLEGQLRETTILFADLRDFTPWVEASEPRAVVRDLNAYFTEMEGAIRRHGGLVLQFIGDEIEAVFGAPLPDPRHADRAVAAAADMRRRLAAWNAERERAGKPPLRHGIGIHSGLAVAGNIGSADRLAYALVGDPVNLASRIQGLTKELGVDVLVSEATRDRLQTPVALEPLPAVRVKGKSAEIEVYRLL